MGPGQSAETVIVFGYNHDKLLKDFRVGWQRSRHEAADTGQNWAEEVSVQIMNGLEGRRSHPQDSNERISTWLENIPGLTGNDARNLLPLIGAIEPFFSHREQDGGLRPGKFLDVKTAGVKWRYWSDLLSEPKYQQVLSCLLSGIVINQLFVDHSRPELDSDELRLRHFLSHDLESNYITQEARESAWEHLGINAETYINKAQEYFKAYETIKIFRKCLQAGKLKFGYIYPKYRQLRSEMKF